MQEAMNTKACGGFTLFSCEFFEHLRQIRFFSSLMQACELHFDKNAIHYYALKLLLNRQHSSSLF